MTAVVDAHVHLLPDRLAQAIRRFFAANGTTGFAYPLDPEIVLARHVDAGIGEVWTLPYAHREGVAARLNADVAALASGWSTPALTVVPGCTVHPDDPTPADDLAAAVEAGARVLKLHCSVGRYEPDDVRLQPVYDAAAQLGVPVVIHAGHGADGRTAADELAPIGRVAAAHPTLRPILAHAGHPATAAAVELLRRHDNLHADLTPVIDDAVDLDAEAVAELSTQLLFGSDTPNTQLAAEDLLDRLRGAGLDAEVLDAVLGGNARRLTGRTT